MSKKRSVFVIFFAAVFALTSAWVLLRSKETDVYLTALSQYSHYSTVLTSKPSTCGVTAASVSEISPKLISSFLAANSSVAEPISLKALTNKFAVANGKKINNAQLASVSPQLLITGQRRLVYLTRVGYSQDRSEALFCVQGLGGGLFHLRYQNGQWNQVQFIANGLI